MIGGLVGYVVRQPQLQPQSFCAEEQYIASDRISFGEKILKMS
jgi:hypothetical protein